MKTDIWKVVIIPGCKEEFEQLCVENDIFYKQYPQPIKDTYRAECDKDKLLDIGHCISTLEEMPILTLS